jgi:carotenoid cleavage dioxygenase
MSFVTDISTRESRVLIIDAKNIEGPPLAEVCLPQCVPLGFHGTWANLDEFEGNPPKNRNSYK